MTQSGGVNQTVTGSINFLSSEDMKGIAAQLNGQLQTVMDYAAAIVDAMKALVQLGEDLKSLRDQIKAERDVRQALVGQRSALESSRPAIPDLVAPVKDSKGKVTNQAAVDAAQKAHDAAVAKNNEISGQIGDIDGKITIQDKKIADLEGKVEDKLKEIQGKCKEIQDLNRKKETAERELDRMRDRARDSGEKLPQEIDHKERELKDLEAKISQLREGVKKESKSLASLATDRAAPPAVNRAIGQAAVQLANMVDPQFAVSLSRSLPQFDQIADNNQAINSRTFKAPVLDTGLDKD